MPPCLHTIQEESFIQVSVRGIQSSCEPFERVERILFVETLGVRVVLGVLGFWV
jgi:hypothetical protein